MSAACRVAWTRAVELVVSAPLIAVALAPLACAALLVPGAARASFGGASLISGTAKLQFEEAEAPAIARDGEHVAFQGSLAGVSGVWRRDQKTGVVEPVATAYDADDPSVGAPTPALSAPDATAPSISGNGQYVAFTTTADLQPQQTVGGAGEPESDRGCPEVYVRDMNLPAGAPGAYTLASALSDGEGIAFEGPCSTGGGSGFSLAGAQAAAGVALSSDGQSVVFTVLSKSDLGSLGAGVLTTPPSQVAVRNLATGATTLVTTAATPQRSGQPVLGGGAYPSQESEQAGSLRIASDQAGDQPTGSTAAISSGGTAVAWLGTDVPEQAPGGSEEIEAGVPYEPGKGGFEVEPLWRRIADGAGASTRRLLAGVGLDFLFHLSETGEAPLNGSFVAMRSAPVFAPPALSEDGSTVALVANAPHPAALPSLRLSGNYPPQTDAYVVHVSDDAATAPQVVPLTETQNYDTRTGAEGFVKDVAISPGGNLVAFDAERNQFTLPSGFALTSPPATSRVFQTYEADIELRTLQRVTVTYNGAEPTNGGAGLLSLGSEGAIAFASGATNLFYGDAIAASEVYEAHELPSEEPPAKERVGGPPAQPLPQMEWTLDATAEAKPDGAVIVHVQAPGAGNLAIEAKAELPSPRSSASLSRSRGPSRSRHATKPSAVKLETRSIAHAAASTEAPADLSLRLSAGSAYRARVASRHGLYAVLHIAFSAAGHATLRAQIPVSFHESSRAGRGGVAAHKKRRAGKERTTRGAARGGRQRAGGQG